MTRWADDAARFEHECHRVLDVIELGQIRIAGLFEGLRIRSVTAHAIVKARTARQKAFGLRVVRTMDQTHELARDVAVKPWQTKRVLHGQNPRRKGEEVDR